MYSRLDLPPSTDDMMRERLPLLMKSLQEGQISVNHTDLCDMSLAGWAARLGKLDDLRLLVDRGASINFRSKSCYRSVLEFAVDVSWDNLEVVNYLLSVGVDLEYAGYQALLAACDRKHIGIVKRLLKAGVNPNPQSGTEASLHVAARYSGSEFVQELISCGAEPNYRHPTSGWTALLHAAAVDDRAVVRILLLHGAEVNAADKNGWTAVHWAAVKGNFEVISILIEHKADVTARTKAGETPLHFAALNCFVKTAGILADAGCDLEARLGQSQRTALHIAAMVGSLPLVELLFIRSEKPNHVDIDGLNALHYAAKRGHTDVVSWLMKQQHEILDVEFKDSNGFTPLQAAAIRGHVETAELLLECGAKINAVNTVWFNPSPVPRQYAGEGGDGLHTNLTALHMAISAGHTSMVDLLLRCGADTEVVESTGISAIHIAAWRGRPEIIYLLCANGANPHKTDASGRTPYSIGILQNAVVPWLANPATVGHLLSLS